MMYNTSFCQNKFVESQNISSWKGPIWIILNMYCAFTSNATEVWCRHVGHPWRRVLGTGRPWEELAVALPVPSPGSMGTQRPAASRG